MEDAFAILRNYGLGDGATIIAKFLPFLPSIHWRISELDAQWGRIYVVKDDGRQRGRSSIREKHKIVST